MRCFNHPPPPQMIDLSRDEEVLLVEPPPEHGLVTIYYWKPEPCGHREPPDPEVHRRVPRQFRYVARLREPVTLLAAVCRGEQQGEQVLYTTAVAPEVLDPPRQQVTPGCQCED